MNKITIDRAVVEQAMKAMLNFPGDISDEMFESIRALRAALAEPAKEPVAWMVYTEGGASAYVTDNPRDLIGAYKALPLYTAPFQRMSAQNELDDAMRTPRAMAQAYEAGWRAALAQLEQVGWMQKSTGVIRCDWGFDTTGYVPVYAAQEKE